MSSSTAKPARITPMAAFADWARTDGLAWVYIFKAVLAALLALWIAMRLDMQQPRTAMTTVFVVMQPQSGMVLAKSFYRFCGTMVGLVVMLALIGLFAQQPVLFLSATALWVGICTAGAARNRNFRSYGFVLAGYTAALIGIPAAQHADGAYLSALTRVGEVTLGIVCAGAVSALVFPQHAGEQIRATVRRRFTQFVDYVCRAMSGHMERAQIERANLGFVADIVGFEAARTVAMFEHPESRRRGGRLARLNSEFMTASTRFHALHQLMNRLRDSASATTIAALTPFIHEVPPLLLDAGVPVRNAAEAAHAAARLRDFKAALPKRVRSARETRTSDPAFAPLEFDTATELLYRFVDDMLAYAETYASLASPSHERERSAARYVPKTNLVAAAIAGVRGAIVMFVLSAFWIATAWPSGGTMVLNAAAVCALASSSARPTLMSAQMAIGTALAAAVGMIVVFGVFPHMDGFVLMCVALVPALLLGTFLSTRRPVAGVGIGYCIFFCFLAGPDNLVHYDPTGFMNDAIALVLSMIVSAVAFAIFLPTDAPWLRRLLLADLRREVVLARRGRLASVATRFESRTRDVLSQIDALAAGRPALQREALQWLFAVLEVGRAVIDLRREIAALSDAPDHSASLPWRREIDATLDAVARLFDRPGAARFDAALKQAGTAIAQVQRLIAASEHPREERHRLQRMLSHLHFIRTALLDRESPFATLEPDSPQGAPHAA
ncbi:FUSC family protein [Caballeronia sp. LZ062]|uniref:FUSC family protein n=1 Tax=unclassified Caballeronia TaxID=2646786 RepID=UPI002867251E|nr:MULTISPECIES: FUSC family protein [unclassified Caballeronia]MDR5854248.1 FUSC family protein [Caballeronia sp. LZ050]MDR5871221.1 FUSC family protein [Caballeronia sp. LZ062]